MKLEFLVIVVCGILRVSGESQTFRLLGQPRGCGQPSASGKPFERIGKRGVPLRKHPWAVSITALQWATGGPRKTDKRRECGGAVVSKWFVLTSTYCVTTDHPPASATYHINYGYRKNTIASKVHVIGESSFVLLEVDTPFAVHYTICLTHVVDTSHLNRTLWSASWTPKDVPGSNSMGSICLEQWTRAKNVETCHALYVDPKKHCTCALSDEVGKDKCRDEAGTPVMQWDGFTWYLIGVTTGGDCLSEPKDELLFETFGDEELDEIERLLMLKADPEDRDPDDLPPQRSYCGLDKKLQLGTKKQIAPFVLTWIVSVYGYAGSRTKRCIGTIIRSDLVLTAKECLLKGPSREASYSVFYDPKDASGGYEYEVENVLRSKRFGSSFVVLELAIPVGRKRAICVFFGPYRHGGTQVVAASWAFNDVRGRFKRNRLYYEAWTLPYHTDICDGKFFEEGSRGNQTSMCAEAGTDAYYACQGDLGTPVMYRYGGNWYLVGMVTHVDKGREDCELRKTRRRVFTWLSSSSKTVWGPE